jgi:hypothetical protein
MNQGDEPELVLPPPQWPVRVVWVILGLIVLSLSGIAIILLVRMDLFSEAGQLTDEQVKSLWAFVGVSLGSAATMIGTLLAEQNNRRTAAQAQQMANREARARQEQFDLAKVAEKRLDLDTEHQHRLADETQQRLQLDTVARVLELITVDGEYAPEARIAGAMATMMQLQGDVVAIRILRALWAEKRIETNTAVWLIGRVLENPVAKSEDLIEAAGLLAANADKLLPGPGDENQDWMEWPLFLRDSWPALLPTEAKKSLIVMAVKVLLAREPNFWQDRGDRSPIRMLRDARVDDEIHDVVAHALLAILDVLDDQGLKVLGLAVDDRTKARLRTSASSVQLAPWFARLLSQFGPWASAQRGQVAATGQDQPSETRDEGLR